MADIFDEVSAPKDIFDEVSVEEDIFDQVSKKDKATPEYTFPLTIGEALLGKPDYTRSRNRANAAYQGFREGTNMALEGGARGASGTIGDVATGIAQVLEGTRSPILGIPFGAFNREGGPMFNTDVLAAAKKDTEDKLALVAENPVVKGLDWYADAVRDLREKIKKDVPVDPEYSRSLEGQIVQGIGQMASQLPSYVIPGVGPALTVGQLYQEGYDDYVQTQEANGKKVDPQAAHHAGMANAPAASLEYLGDKLLIGRALGPLKGKIKVKDIAANIIGSLVSEGATEGAQQFWLNIVAKQLRGYDPERELDQDVINSIIVGGLVGSMVTTATSTTSLKNLEGGETEVDSAPPAAPTEDGGSTPPASPSPEVQEEINFVENPPVESVPPIVEEVQTEEQAGATTVDLGVEQLEVRDIVDQVGLPEGVEGDVIVPDVTPQQDGAPVVRNTVALKKAEIAGIREVLELSALPEAETQHWTEVAQNVKAKGLDQTADQLALALVSTPRVISAEEQMALAIRETQLQDQYFSKLDEAEKALDRGDIPRYRELTKTANELARSLDTVTQAGLYGGREIGRALSARRARINRDRYTIAKVRQRAKQAKASAKTQEGRAITQQESKEYADLVKRLEAEQEKIAKLSESISQMEAQVNREEAQTFFNARKVSARKIGNIAERRASYKERLKELGYRTNDITNLIGLSAEASSLVSKIAETYIEEGVANLTDLTNKMKQDLPDLSENDIYNALGGRIAKKKRQVESRVKKQLKEMRAQARLWADVHALLDGPLKTKRIENKSSAQVIELRNIVARLRKQAYKTINEDAQLKRVHLALDKIQDQIEGGFRYIPEAKEKTPAPSPALTQAKQSLKEARQIMGAEDILADLEEQLRTDELAIPRQQPQIANARLRKIKDMIKEKRKEISKRRREAANTEQAQIDRLLKKLETLEQQIEGGYRFLKNKGRSQAHNTVQVQELKDTIRETERLMRTQDSIEDLLEQLRTGVYKTSAKEQRVIKNAELQEALVQERALKKLIDHKIERARRKALPWYSHERALDIIQTPRTLLATADHSAVLRQGLILSFSRPIVAAKAIAAAEKAFWSEHTAHQIDIAIRNHPNQIERDAAGLFLSEIDGAGTQAEENFFSSIADRLPLVTRSSRHMATYLNLIRTAAFDDFITKHPEATIEQKKAYAEYVNIASGRGNLGKFAGAADWLSTVFFAPRFTVSRIQALYTPLRPKYLKDPILRKAVAKDYMAFVGTGLTVLALAAAFGATVGLDPEDSDFGKIVIGDTRIDIWGGLQQPARLIAMTIMSFFDGDGEYLDMVPEGDIDPTDAALRFTTYKFAPWWSGTKMLTTGKDAVGNEVTLLPTEMTLEALADSAAFRLTTPLILQETMQVMATDEDPGIVALSAAGTFWGLGVNTYEKK